MVNKKPPNSNISKRKFLKAAATTGAILSIPVVNATAKNNDEIIDLRGKAADPVLPEQALEAINENANANAKRAVDQSPIPQSESDDRFVAAYLEKTGDDGVPFSYIGYTYDDERGNATEDIHKTADKVRSAMENAATASEYNNPVGNDGNIGENRHSDSAQNNQPQSLNYVGSNDYETLSTNVNDGSYWNFASRRTGESESDNGKVTIDAEMYQFDLDKDGYSNKSAWASVVTNRATPYANNLRRHVDDMEVRQDWEKNSLWDVESPGISETQPSGQIDGSYSSTVGISVGSGGASGTISWSYDQPDVTMIEETDQIGNENAAVWKYEPNVDYSSPLQAITGSQCWVESFDGSSCSIQDSTNTSLGTASNWANFNGWAGGDVEVDVTMLVPIC